MRRVEQVKRLGQLDQTKRIEEQVIVLVRQGMGDEGIAQEIGRARLYVQRVKRLLREEGRL